VSTWSERGGGIFQGGKKKGGKGRWEGNGEAIHTRLHVLGMSNSASHSNLLALCVKHHLRTPRGKQRGKKKMRDGEKKKRKGRKQGEERRKKTSV